MIHVKIAMADDRVNTCGQDFWGDAGSVETTTLKHQPFRYTGEQHDAESGLTYLRARYYDPAAGRFMSRDTFGGYAKKSQSQNRYAYSANNPTTLRDPSGRDPSANPMDPMYGSKVPVKDDGTFQLLDSNGEPIPDAYWVEEDKVIVLNGRPDLLSDPSNINTRAQAFGKNVIVGRNSDSVKYGSYTYHHEFRHLQQARATPCVGDAFDCFARHPVAEAIYAAEQIRANAKAAFEGNPGAGYYFNRLEQGAHNYACGKVPTADQCGVGNRELWILPWWAWIT